jgi:tetratricopeptide (TPR) repeat protein
MDRSRIDTAIETADRLAVEGNAQGALKHLQALGSEGAEDAVVRSLSAMYRLYMGQARHALEEAEAALKLDPLLPLAHWSQGRALMELGKLSQAHDATLRGIDLDPDSPAGLHLLIQILRRQDKPKEAIGHLKAYLQDWPDDADMMAILAELLIWEGRLRDAEPLVQMAQTLEPTSPQVLYSSALMALHTGRDAEAWDLTRQILRDFPGDQPTLALMVQLKSKGSLALGLWWRLSFWVEQHAWIRWICTVLIIVALQAATKEHIRAHPAGMAALIAGSTFILIMVVGGLAFKRMVKAELAKVQLKADF